MFLVNFPQSVLIKQGHTWKPHDHMHTDLILGKVADG